MLMSEEQDDHFLTGRKVSVEGDIGIVQTVNEHTVDVNGDRETYTRVIVKMVDTPDSTIRNVSSSSVEVLR